MGSDSMLQATFNFSDEELQEALKNELEHKREELVEVNWSARQAGKKTGLGYERVLAVFKCQGFKKELDAENGGPVLYPYQGGGYQINPVRFVKFCNEHWLEIMNLDLRRN